MNRLNLAAVVLAVMCTGARAEEWRPVTGFSIGGRVVDMWPRSGDDTVYGGAQARLQGRVLGLEGSVDVLRHEGGEVRVTDWPVLASLTARLFPDSRATPFALAGLGWYNTTVEATDRLTGNVSRDTRSRLGYHAGAGVEIFLNRSWSVDGTWRHVWVESADTRDASVRDKRWDNTGNMVTTGLNLHF